MSTLFSLVVGGILLAVLAAGGGYALSLRSRSVEPSPTPPPGGSPAPSNASPAATASPAVVRGTATASPTPSAPPSPAPSQEVRVTFVDLPSRVRSGQSFTVSWRVEGPAGATVETTALEARTATSAGGSGGSSSASSTSTNTFGGVPAPHTFSTTLAFGGSAREVTVSVTATVSGKTATAGPVTLPLD